MTGQIGIDTCFLIDFFNGDKKAIAFFEQNAEKMAIHDLIVFEFLCGNLSKKQAELFKEKIQLLPTVPITRKTVILAAELYRQQKEKGKNIGSFDVMIAAGFLSNDIDRIVTRNSKHLSQTKIQILPY